MKQGNTLTTLVMTLLAAALAIYLGFHVIQSFQDPFTTTYTYEYTAGDSVMADGFLVREERPFDAPTGILELRRTEGERVGVGQTVALVYRDSQAMQVQSQIQQLRLEAEILSYALDQGGEIVSSARLDQTILSALADLRAAAGTSDFSRLEDQAVGVKSAVLKRDYIYGEGLSAADLAQRQQTVSAQIIALTTQNTGASTAVKAVQPGIYSALLDGYESLLTPDNMYSFTPSQLKELAGRSISGQADHPGKLILGSRWYLLVSLPRQAAARLREGGAITVRFSGDFTQDVEMTIEQVGSQENGYCAVVFSSERYLAQTTLLRRQVTEVIYQSFSGLRVPKAALRMVTRETVDAETEQITHNQTLGVYALVAGKAEFKPVETVLEGSDFFLVRPAGNDSSALRAGDEIIVHATDLYHGKLLEY